MAIFESGQTLFVTDTHLAHLLKDVPVSQTASGGTQTLHPLPLPVGLVSLLSPEPWEDRSSG